VTATGSLKSARTVPAEILAGSGGIAFINSRDSTNATNHIEGVEDDYQLA